MSPRAWFYGVTFSLILWGVIAAAVLLDPRIAAGFALAVGAYIAVVTRP